MSETVKQASASSRITRRKVLLSIAAIIVIGLAAVALKPDGNLSQARNAQRQTDTAAILNATYGYLLDNNGTVPSGITMTATEVCATGAASCTGLVDLTALTTSGKYLVAIPKDPQCAATCAANGTGYKILKDTNGRITVNAPFAEQGKTISVTR